MKKLFVFIFIIFSLVHTKTALAAPKCDPINMSAECYGDTRDSFHQEGNISLPNTGAVSLQTMGWEIVRLLGDRTACSANPDQQKQCYQNSLSGQITNGIAYLYANPAADINQFIAYYGQKAGVVKPAYAQGIGFSGLTPILGLWRVFRNVAYGFLIVIMVMIGFMVLFRMKIDPRTVVSVQNALPRVVVTLILITFSYAIVGLLIDMMYLLIFISIAVIRSSNVVNMNLTTSLQYSTGGPLADIYAALISIHGNSIGALVNLLGGATLQGVGAAAGGIVGATIGKLVHLPLAGTVGLGVGAAAAGFITPNVIAAAILWIAVIFALIRIFIMLISAYIQIILGVVFAPLQIMFDAIPNTGAFSGWFRNIVANILVFPVTSILLLIAIVIAYAVSQPNSPTMWVPPGLTGQQAAGAAGIIGLGIALSIPTIVNSLKEALKAKPPIQAGAGPIFAPVGTLTGIGMQMLSTSYYLKGAPGWIRKNVLHREK